MKTFSTVAAIVAVILVLVLFYSILNVDQTINFEDSSDVEVESEESNNTVTQTFYIPYDDVVEQTMTVVVE